jgi:hypothetical protein
MLHACLYTICSVFSYTSWSFYAFSRTNLLVRCHSASSLFLLLLCFRKATQEIFLELDEKSQNSYFSQSIMDSKAETEENQVVWPPGPPSNAALPHIYSPRRENLKGPINFPWNILQVATVIDARSGGSRSSSRHPAGEGNHRRRLSSSPCLPPEWCASSLP